MKREQEAFISAAVSEPRKLSNREKNTFFFETEGIVVKGLRNCGYARMEELRYALYLCFGSHT